MDDFSVSYQLRQFFHNDEEGREDNEEEEEFLLILLLLRRKIMNRKIRTVWVKVLRNVKNRLRYGVYHTLIPHMTDEEYQLYLRVTRGEFEMLHNYVRHDIEKKYTNFREPISTRHRLAICLRFLASGETFLDIGFHFRVGESTVSGIVKEVCDSLWLRMKDEYLPEPDEAFWLQRAEEFQQRWNFSHCISAVDGKHVIIRKPQRTGSEYFNYKKAFSIVLMAGADAHYRFTFVDVGRKGRFSDGFTFGRSNFGSRLLSNRLNLPRPAPLFPGGPDMPYVIVADAAFPLQDNLMRPFPGTSTKTNRDNRVYNYRLSHARQVIECAFGILTARFRIYSRPLELQPPVVEKLIKATCVLHNFLRRNLRSIEEETSNIPSRNFSTPEDQLIDVPSARVRASKNAYYIRELFKQYFLKRDIIPYQFEAIKRGKY